MANVVIKDLDQTRVRFEANVRRVGEKDAKTAFARALRHEGRKAHTAVKRSLRTQTSVKTGDIAKEVKFQGPKRDALTAEIRSTGKHRNISYFGAKQFSYGVRAKVWGRAQRFPSAFFIGQYSNNVFVRQGKPRFPVRQVVGPSLPREMVRDETLEAFESKLNDVSQRAMHELTRILLAN